jgi:hypothetical protein
MPRRTIAPLSPTKLVGIIIVVASLTQLFWHGIGALTPAADAFLDSIVR